MNNIVLSNPKKIGVKIDIGILSVSLGMYLLFLIVNVFEKNIIGLPSIMSQSIPIIKGLMYITLIMGIIFSIINMRNLELYYIGGIILLFIANYLCYSEIPERFPSYFNTFITACFPLSLLAFKMDGEKTLKILEKIGYFAGALFFFMLVGMLAGRLHMNSYVTSIGYSVLLPEVTLVFGIKNKKGIYRVLSIASIAIISLFVLLFCSRGPLIVIVFYSAYEFIYCEYKAGSKKKIIIAIIALLLILFLIYNSNSILNYIQQLTGKKGISSRTIYLLTTDAAHNSGRDNIYSSVISQISAHPFSIRGIASDTEIIMGNQYTHNILLELLYQFGLLFGGVSIIAIIILFIKSIRFSVYEKDSFVTICAFVAIIQLMFSSSLWLNYVFWVWIARAISLKKRIQS